MSIAKQTVNELLVAIAEKQPTPGGGAVAGVTLALAASLTQMVVNYSLGKKALAEHSEAHNKALAFGQSIMARAVDLADQDAIVYAALNTLMRDKSIKPDSQAMQGAVRDAIEVPTDVLHRATQLAELVESLLGKTNTYLDSDLAMAAILAEAAAQSACWNIRINLPSLADPTDRAAAEVELKEHMERAAAATRRVLDALQNKPE